MFLADDPEWRKWMNQHFYVRQGIRSKKRRAANRGLRAARGVTERAGHEINSRHHAVK
jgi:hypothetical protein